MEILHVDMDAFFASVEQFDHPEWRGRPVIVGAGPHERGVVSTCSYEARKFGVHSAMPSRTAYALCPQGIFVPPRMRRYREVSEAAFEVFSHYSPFVQGVSVDEAFLDVSGTTHLFGGRVELAERLRAEVKATCGVTCSVGLAPNRLLAKIGSEQRKPDGLFEMPFEAEAIRAFLAPKPVGVLWGVGRKTESVLLGYGYRTCGDLQRADPRFLAQAIGETAAASIRAHAFGVDDSGFAADDAAEKSVSRENTFPEDVSDRETVRAALLELVCEVGRRFRRERRWALTAKLKLRDAAFDTISRQTKFGLPARDDMTFREKALALFDAAWPETGGKKWTVRLVGFGVSDFTEDPGAGEPTLFGPDPRVAMREKRERLSDALDSLHFRAAPQSPPPA